jgi:hypothetical protein
MADANKTSFAVSVTPKMAVDKEEGVFQAMTVINEDVRKSVGGSGEITGSGTTVSGGWANGTNTPATSNGTEYAVTTSTDMLFIKHTGLLIDGVTASAAADTLKVTIHGDDTTGVSGDVVLIAELANGEAFLIPRPPYSITYKLVTGNSSNHVGAEVLIIGT